MDFLKKPFPSDQLLGVMRRAVEIGARQRALDEPFKTILSSLGPDNAAALHANQQKLRALRLLKLMNYARRKA